MVINSSGIFNLGEVRELLGDTPSSTTPLGSPAIDTEFVVSEILSTDQTRWVDYPTYASITSPASSGVVFDAEILPPTVYLIDKSIGGTNLTTIDFSSRMEHELIGDQLDLKLFKFDDIRRLSAVVTVSDQLQLSFTSHTPVNTINVTHAIKLFAGQVEVTEFRLDGLTVDLLAPYPIGTVLTLVLGVDSIPTIVQLIEGSDYTLINNSLIRWHYNIADWVQSANMAFFIIQPQLPQYSRYAPIRIVNNGDKSIVKTINRWDPKFNLHSSVVSEIDVTSSVDPAVYSVNKTGSTKTNTWTSNQVGTYWWDTTHRQYRPYNDQHIASFDQGTSTWGQMYEGSENQVYQWVESNKLPTALSGTATPYSRVLSKTREFNDITLWQGGTTSTIFQTVQPLKFDTGRRVSVYVREGTESIKSTPGVELGVPHILTKLTPSTFTLTTESGDLIVCSTTLTSGEFRIADSDWGRYTSVEEPHYIERFYCYDNLQHSSNTINPVFIPYTPAVIARIKRDDALTVWLNGVSTTFTVDQVTAEITLTGDAASTLSPQDIIDVGIPQPSPTIARTDGDLLDSNNSITIYFKDFPYSERNDGVKSTYYFWLRAHETIPATKALSTSQVEIQLTTGESTSFFVLRNPSRATPTSAYTYDVLTTKGLFELNSPKPNTHSIAIDFDPTIRTQYTSEDLQKVSHDQWIMFRPQQKNKILPFVWRKVMQTISGIEPDTNQVVPSSTRSTYDFLNNTRLRFGTGDDQVLIDTTKARELWKDFLITSSFADADRTAILEILQLPLNTSSDYIRALTQMYQTCAVSTTNDLAFLVLNVALYEGNELKDLMKTSYISLNASQKIAVG
jgi:hypothetical protein